MKSVEFVVSMLEVDTSVPTEAVPPIVVGAAVDPPVTSLPVATVLPLSPLLSPAGTGAGPQTAR
jgi:hypothetical protein